MKSLPLLTKEWYLIPETNKSAVETPPLDSTGDSKCWRDTRMLWQHHRDHRCFGGIKTRHWQAWLAWELKIDSMWWFCQKTQTGLHSDNALMRGRQDHRGSSGRESVWGPVLPAVPVSGTKYSQRLSVSRGYQSWL